MERNKCDCKIINKELVEKTLKELPSNLVIDEITSFFKIIGDTTRIKILFILDNNELCVCDIANILNMTKSSISHQLKTLKKYNIIKSRRFGKNVFYSLDDEHVKEVFDVALIHTSHKKENIND